MKKKRQEAILELIKNERIGTQSELTERLVQIGVIATQATVSRDIRELGIIKLGDAYGVPAHKETGNKLLRILRDGYLSMDSAGNIMVIKTNPGMAMAVAAALDSLEFSEILGCIAGDDTIMAVVRSTEAAEEIKNKLEQYIFPS
jgi:transcriptional regulator of arginine metabolism